MAEPKINTHPEMDKKLVLFLLLLFFPTTQSEARAINL